MNVEIFHIHREKWNLLMPLTQNAFTALGEARNGVAVRENEK